MSSSKSQSKAEQGIAQAGATAYSRSKMTDPEEEQYNQSFNLGSLLRQLYLSRMFGQASPSGYIDPTQQYMNQTGELGKTYYDQTLNEAKDPYAYYQDTLQPQLDLAQDSINRYYQSRGLINSGMNIESMGRAGTDLAIRSAGERMQYRDAALQRAFGLTDYIQGIEQGNIGGATDLYNNQQQYGLQGMNRQAGAAQNVAQYQAYPYQARLGNIYGQKSAMYALPSQIIGAAGNIGMGMAMGGTGIFKQ